MLRQPRLVALVCALCALTPASAALAQPSEAGDHVEEELPPGHPGRTSGGGSYAWGDGGEVAPGAPARPETHRYARLFLGVGAGLSFRMLIYVDTLHHDESGLAPWYLQLRPVYFFEGDGMFQHGVGLGIAPNLTGDGLEGYVEAECNAGLIESPCTPAGIDPFTAWTFVPGYHLRVWFDDWVQLTARVGFGVTAAQLPNVGLEVGVGAVVKFLAGLGVYAEASVNTYFAADVHPLVSLEAGMVVDYELLP